MDPQQNGTGVPQQQAGGQNGNVPNMAPNQRVQQPGPNQQGGPAQNGQQRQAQQSQQQLMQQINLEQFQRMMPAEVQRAPQAEQLAYIRKLITTQKARSGNAANAAAGAGVQGQVSYLHRPTLQAESRLIRLRPFTADSEHQHWDSRFSTSSTAGRSEHADRPSQHASQRQPGHPGTWS